MPPLTSHKPRIRLSLVTGLAGLWLLAGTVEAGDHRIALSLTGKTCDRQRATIETALKMLPGVHAVDVRSVPGHILVDLEEGRVTADQAVSTVNGLKARDGSCAAQEMKSCITAEMSK
ncbi:MAG: hypothetical protein FJ245_03615 [Nitrospira sp.]|nr:hypothetical protein [Nitrospira sp.]